VLMAGDYVAEADDTREVQEREEMDTEEGRVDAQRRWDATNRRRTQQEIERIERLAHAADRSNVLACPTCSARNSGDSAKCASCGERLEESYAEKRKRERARRDAVIGEGRRRDAESPEGRRRKAEADAATRKRLAKAEQLNEARASHPEWLQRFRDGTCIACGAQNVSLLSWLAKATRCPSCGGHYCGRCSRNVITSDVSRSIIGPTITTYSCVWCLEDWEETEQT